MNWKEYQHETANFFRSLGCDADVEAKVTGARAEHVVDVWVRFRRFGFETKWVIECKYWNSAVPKEKVLALKSIVEDVGADRGLLLSAAGFQSGAVHASEKTNITLSDLESLKETAREDLLSSLLQGLETKAVKVKYALYDFLASKRQAGTFGYLDFGLVPTQITRAWGNLITLEFGFDQVRLKRSPYTVTIDNTGQRLVEVETLEEFMAKANEVIQAAERELVSLYRMRSK